MFVDIAFNATSKSICSLPDEMSESKSNNVMPLLVGLDTDSSAISAKLAHEYSTFSYFGIHPLHIPFKKHACLDVEQIEEEISKDMEYFEPLLCSSLDNVIALGECGLDYFRSNEKEIQKIYFEKQLEIAKRYGLPCFIHCRKAFKDVYDRLDGIKGVVHSFDGTIEEAEQFINLGLNIGINGCSMREEENIGAIKEIPIEKILIETDSPYCLIRKSYAASKFVEIIKSKENRPAYIRNVVEALAVIKEMDLIELEEQLFSNTKALFTRIEERINCWTN